jgi:hypothetical protein
MMSLVRALLGVASNGLGLGDDNEKSLVVKATVTREGVPDVKVHGSIRQLE